jgi:hypothetical protein
VPLAALRLHRRARLSYVYNFIDHWGCELRLEGMLPWEPQHHYLVCLGGKQAAPPEDGGRPWAYLQWVDQHDVPWDAMATVATARECVLKAKRQTSIQLVIGASCSTRPIDGAARSNRQSQTDEYAGICGVTFQN